MTYKTYKTYKTYMTHRPYYPITTEESCHNFYSSSGTPT